MSAKPDSPDSMEKQAKSSLRAGCLNFTEITAIAIALISPTMTGALIIPLMYSNAGNASWLAYLFGTVIGFTGYHTPLARAEAPLNILANLMNMPYLKIPLSAGAAVSSFSAALSCLNAGARILYPMGRHGLLHSSLGAAHATNETPHVAVTILGALLFLIPAAMLWLPGTRALDIFNCAGTLCALGFLGAYGLISASAPAYLARMGAVRGRDFWIAAASLALLLFPVVGSVYPVPQWPVNTYPYMFLAYLVVGMVWVVRLHRGTPGLANDVRRRIYTDHGHDVRPQIRRRR